MKHSTARSWARALELTAPITSHPNRLLPAVLEERASEQAEAPALLADVERFSYRDLVERSNQYSRWALGRGIAKGDVVCLLMRNRPEYMAIWLGITRVGGVVALLNTNLVGVSLAHCINIVAPSHVIVAAELVESLATAVLHLSCPSPAILAHGAGPEGFIRLDREVDQYSGSALDASERRPVTIEDRALYIYTSGTTGLPKAANVNHARLMQWSHWFAGLMGTTITDRMFNCLPMYHSVGGVLSTGAVLVGGGSVVLRETFSARQFWADIVRWECTLFQYIGELCRYVLNAEPHPCVAEHRVRLACGNGLRADIWADFQRRFRIPQILEFYASTEGNVSLFNVEGKSGAVGRVPPFLAHRFSPALVKFDVETSEPVRDEQGRCVPCAVNEAGEAIGKLSEDRSNVGSRFDGYTDVEASEKKVLRDVFKPGDAWFRTGDLMRKDDQGFFYFVDRVGDTFRWKGENVSTSEVSEAICAFPGVKEANVYGVTIPGCDGRAAMAVLVADENLDLATLRAHLIGRLPDYACPLFLRVRREIGVTSTFKYTKTGLVRQGFDPGETDDAIFFNARDQAAFVPLGKALFERIRAGGVRL